METINQTIETTAEAVDMTVTSETFNVSTFDALKFKLDAENLDIETTKANKLSTLMQAKMDLFTSSKPMDEMLKLDAELTNQIIAVQNSGKMDINSVVNNNAKFVLYDGILYRYDNKQVRIASGKASGETSAKTKTSTLEEQFSARPTEPLTYTGQGLTLNIGDYNHVIAQMKELGFNTHMSVYAEHLLIKAGKDKATNFPSGVPGWKNVNFLNK